MGLALSFLVGCTFSATGTNEPPGSGPTGGMQGPDGGTAAPLAIAFDAKSQAAITDATSLTWQHAIGSDHAVLFVGASIEKDGPTATAITYAGIPLTRSTVEVGGNGVRAELWYLTSPPVGTADIAITFSAKLGSDGAVAGAVSLANVDLTAPIEGVATNGASSGSPSTVITTSDDGAWLFDVVMIDNGDNLMPTGSQLPRWDVPVQEIAGSGSTLQATPGSHTMSWSSTSDNWAQIVAAIRPAR